MRVILACLFLIVQSLDGKTIDQKIGKLFCVPACPERGDDHRADLKYLIEKYHVRAFILKQGTVAQSQALIKWLEEIANDPILIVADAEWGLGMRISDAPKYPKNEALSKLNFSEIYNVGKSIAKDCIKLGVQLNLAPVIDINSNPKNIIIKERSFGSNAKSVAESAYWIAKGMKDAGLAICLKHFPGHGDVELDSHKELPFSNKSINDLYKEELLPYIKIKKLSPNCVMLAHILYRKIDSKFPATLSSKVIQLARKVLGNEVLIISDALNMRALTKYYTTPEIVTLAHLAGVELLLYGDHISSEVDKILKEDIPAGIAALKKLYQRDLKTYRLDKVVRKIDAMLHLY